MQGKLAQEIVKDTYDFGFVSLPVGYAEEELEDALEQNITRFLLELGTGFAFIGACPAKLGHTSRCKSDY
ncbi:MAG: PDDEXK nuclease domain-containing protein, partial [Oliverpabstia sp.]